MLALNRGGLKAKRLGLLGALWAASAAGVSV